jgi:RimJ/RimL family protein N-acetyltransferase
MIGDKAYWGQGYGTDAVLAILDYVFTQAAWQSLFLKTLDWNMRAHKCFEKCGFVRKGTLDYNGCTFIIMEISRPVQQKSLEIAFEDPRRTLPTSTG